MTFVTVFRQVPKPITGMIGILYDREFEQFEANLDWLETIGVLVERFDLSQAPQEVANRPAVQQILVREADRCLQLILVNESVVSQGTYLSRAAGSGRGSSPESGAIGSLASIPQRRRVSTRDSRCRRFPITTRFLPARRRKAMSRWRGGGV